MPDFVACILAAHTAANTADRGQAKYPQRSGCDWPSYSIDSVER